LKGDISYECFWHLGLHYQSNVEKYVKEIV